jgi:hypothetical protein
VLQSSQISTVMTKGSLEIRKKVGASDEKRPEAYHIS